MTDYLIPVDQKIPCWLIKTVFLGEDEIAIRTDNKSRFGIMGFRTRDAILGCGFKNYKGFHLGQLVLNLCTHKEPISI